MGQRTRHWIQLGAAASALTIWACVGTGSGDDEGREATQLERAFVRSVAEQVMAPSADAFATEVAVLQTATQAWAAAPEDADTRQAAQEAWVATMQAWQVLEIMQLGPLGPSSERVGGADIRDEVYSWPSVNTCRVDQEIVLAEYDQDDFVQTRLVNSYGLDALEYLLFYDGDANSCPPQLPINADGEWDALDEATLAQRRASYAAAVATALEDQAGQIQDDWGADGAWTLTLADAGEPDSEYASVFEAMDEILAVMFYLDQEVKDLKIAKPAGLRECASESCPGDVEFIWSNTSQEASVANLDGFQRLYFGGDGADTGTGFDDLLLERGAEDLESQMTAAVEAAPQVVLEVSDGFQAALVSDATALDDSHAAVKAITDLLKGEFSTTLELTIPQEGGGDAD